MLSKVIYRAVCLAALFFTLACGGGDDDGGQTFLSLCAESESHHTNDGEEAYRCLFHLS